MQIKLITNVFNKKDIEVFNHLFTGETTGVLFETYTTGIDREDFLCIVSGGKVDWDYVPNYNDEVIFVNNIKAPLIVGLVMVGGLLAAEIITAAMFWAMAAMMVVSYAMSALAKPSVPDGISTNSAFDNSKTYSWDGIQNIIGEGNVVPIVYGRHKIGGVLIEAFVDGSSDGGIESRKYLNALSAVSEGPIHGIVDGSIKINNQNIDYYTGVQTWTRNGYNTQTPIDNFSKIVRHYTYTPLKPIVYGESQIYRTNDASDQLRITIQTPSIYSMNDDGDLRNQSVTLDIYTSPEQDEPAWSRQKIITITGKTKSELEYDAIIDSPITDVPYLVMIERETQEYDTNPKVSCSTYLKSVSEIQNARLSYPGTALFGVRIKATDRLSGSMPTFTAEVVGRALADVRDQSVTEASAKNPANIIYDLLTNVEYGLGRHITDNEIDITSLQEFADWCDEQITYKRWNKALKAYFDVTENRYEINLVIDTKFRAVDLIEKILSSCRALPYWEGNKFKVVIERPSSAYAQMFSMGNIKQGSFNSTYSGIEDVSNQIEIQYLDEDCDYDRRTILAIDKDRAEEYPEVSQANLYGITKASTAKREAVFQMKKAKALKRQISFSASIDAIMCQVGDLILFQHDVPQWGYGGRIVNVLSDRFILDRDVPLVDGKTFTLRVRKSDGTFHVTAYSSLSTIVTNEIPLTPPSDVHAGDLWAFGLVGVEAKPFRVTSIEKQNRREFKLSCTEYNESIFNEDENVSVEILRYSQIGLTETYDLDGSIDNPPVGDPTYNLNSSDPKKEVPPYVTDITVGEQLAIVGNIYRSDIIVTFASITMPVNSLSRIVKYKVIYSTDGGVTWRTDGETDENGYYRILGVNVGETYYILVKPYTNYDITNYPEFTVDALNNVVVVQGKISAPLPPSNLEVTGDVFQNNLDWVNPGEPLDRVEIWCAVENDRSASIKVGSVKGDRFNHSGLSQEITYYYWLRAYDTVGNASPWYPISDTGGVSATPSSDPAKIKSLLTGAIEESQLATSLLEKIDSGGGLSSKVELLSNQWTVKIQENEYIAGAGIALYEDWNEAKSYTVDEYIWGPDSQVYKCIAENAGQQPPNATYWEFIEYGAKSEFIVLSDKFAIVQPDGQGSIKTPFIVGSINGESAVGIDGTMVIDGTVAANKLIAGSITVNNFSQDTQESILNANQEWSDITSRPEDSTIFNSYIPYSVNLCPYSDFSNGTTGWALYYTSGGNDSTWGVDLSSSWILSGEHTGYIAQSSDNGIPKDDYAAIRSDYLPAIPGKRYCFSGYLGAHRCRGMIYIQFLDSGLNTLSYSNPHGYIYASDGKSGGLYLSGYKRCVAFGTAPDSTAFMRVFVRKYVTDDGASPGNSYLFFSRLQLSEATDNQLDAPTYVKYGTDGATWGANIVNQPTSLDDLNSTEYSTLVAAAENASTALANAANAQSTADGKITAFYQTSAPTSGMDAGDLWFDIDAGNKLYRYNGSSWIDIQDDAIATAISAAQTAQTTADGKAVVYYQNSAPSGASIGDLWYDTDDTYKRLYRYSGSAWSVVSSYGATWGTNITNQPSSLNGINTTEYGWISDPAARINTQVTTINGGKITTGSITAAQIAANTIAAAQIAANTITAAQIAANTITASQIAANAITSSELAANAVYATNIVASQVTTDKLVGGAVTTIEMNTSTSGSLAQGSAWVTMIQDSITTVGGNVLVFCNNPLFYRDAGDYTYVYSGKNICIYRDSTLIFPLTAPTLYVAGAMQYARFVLDSPAAGTHTYYFKVLQDIYDWNRYEVYTALIEVKR